MTAAQGGRISRVRANPHVIVTFSGAVRLHYRILLYFLDMKVGLLYNFFKHIHHFLCIFMAHENVYPALLRQTEDSTGFGKPGCLRDRSL